MQREQCELNQSEVGSSERMKGPMQSAQKTTGAKADQAAGAPDFSLRHIGPRSEDVGAMLGMLGVRSLDELVAKTVPKSIAISKALELSPALTEPEALALLKSIASQNQMFRSYIGLGYANTHTPGVILRNIMENPGWYTQYTPYQPEISQGRLEALVNFQTMICDLTGLEVANASLLDEGTAAAEAMTLCARVQNRAKPNAKKFFVSDALHPHTIDILKTRAEPLGIEIVMGPHQSAPIDGSFFGAIVQYPATDGSICSFSDFAALCKQSQVLVVCATDLLALTLLVPPGQWGADVAIGSAQRFGVPLGFGGPHAAFMSCKDEFKREMPGRMIGVSKDIHGKPALRLALQTREQHIRRERATSNICTAQVLLSIMASMYAVYHGPDGLKAIADRVHRLTTVLGAALQKLGIKLSAPLYFDTITTVSLGAAAEAIVTKAAERKMNFRVFENGALGISLDETTTAADVADIVWAFGGTATAEEIAALVAGVCPLIPKDFLRTDKYLTHPVFTSHRSETEMLRYISKLANRDLSLAHSMIPLGSCTMKLNATSEMIPVTWPEFGALHPFAPESQTAGYRRMFADLEHDLAEITGLPAVSLQPNAGSQGEYAGLLVVREFFKDRGQTHRNVCLIPSSAHGTNPASAAMAGMEVVIVKSDAQGNVDIEDLRIKAAEHKEKLAALMITYPSTHGVFEEGIREICTIVHEAGGQVYMDGANLNAQVGLCRAGEFGIDVCHMNLHKTFCIPHGGGGPGMGPIAVAAHLAPYLPGHVYAKVGGPKSGGAVSAAPWGSASILPIPWIYIKQMGAKGLTEATQIAILNANYVAKRLEGHYDVLYRGTSGFVAHECILDLRGLKHAIGIEAADVAKRLMDYGFHAPTVSFPVAETLMVEPTESESRAELDRFCDALISIRNEIREIESGKADKDDNVLKGAPHTAEAVSSDDWTHSYSRSKAAYPLEWVRENKFWPSVGRIDGAYGDRNFCCTCYAIDGSDCQ